MNEKRTAVLEVLSNTSTPMTLADLSSAVGYEIKSGTTNAMVAAGLMVAVGTRKVEKASTRKVATYSKLSSTPNKESYKMTPERVEMLNALESAANPMTLAELSDVLGVKVASGSMNSMVAAGLVVKAGETSVPCTKTVEVAEYVLGNTDTVDAQ